jgi:hypothetical protein
VETHFNSIPCFLANCSIGILGFLDSL